MHGKGTFMWSKGDMYEGHWRAGKMHGHGVKKMGNGDVYEGNPKLALFGDAYEGESRSLTCLASVVLLDACLPAFSFFPLLHVFRVLFRFVC